MKFVSLSLPLFSSIMASRLLEQCRISPPTSSSPRPSLPFTMFDIPWLHFPLMERLFFFPFENPTSYFLSTTLPILKSSLSLTLDLFYPLTATYRRSCNNRFEFHYSDRDSVSLTISEYLDPDFYHLSGHHARSMEKLLLLLPDLHISPDSQPLLAIKVTIFPNQGLCLAFVFHHTVCDGFSFNYFLKSWAAACRGSPPLSPPFLDRSVITDPHGIYWKISEQQNNQPIRPCLESNSSMAIATFTLDSNHINRLKHRAMAKAGEEGKPPFHCSTFVVACAYAWVCHVKARGFHGDLVTHLLFAVDWRQRIRPSIPPTYFGNCLGSPCLVEARVGEITGKDGVLIACETIGKSIEGIGSDVIENMDGFVAKVMELRHKKPLGIAGSPKLRAYDTDFGWGKPLKTDVVSIQKTRAISIGESRDEVGGIEIGIALPYHEIDEYSKHFSSEM